MDRQELFAAIRQDLSDRTSWDERQKLFYTMRHHGLRRKQKPWPGASDVHIPLGDMAIERLKPYYFQQIFATDLIAAFVPQVNQVAELTTTAAQWFDYQLKQQSNIESEILTAIDHILVNGKGVIKPRWDVETQQIKFDAIDPQHLIVPTWTKCLEEADRIVHVQTYSPEAFRRQGYSISDPSKLIAADDTYEQGDSGKAQAKKTREGLTHSTKGQVIVWEVWTRDDDGDWQYETFSPQDPETSLKPLTKSPYDYKHAPFISLDYEIKDSGWYAPRGVMEQIAVFEVEATRLQNEKNDAMTLYNRPLFKAGREVPNSANLRFKPGSILPYDIAPVTMPQPPISFDQQMSIMRQLAQQRVTTPDFGISSIADNGSDRRTATEVQAISGLHQQSSDLRMRVFRHGLAKLYRCAWELLLQYKSKDLVFWHIDTRVEANEGALHLKYGITPSGSADGVNKPLLVQKAFQRYELMLNNPFVDQGELTKSVLEVDDATLVRRLYKDPGIQDQEQSEDQAHEIAILKLGFPAVVHPADNHEVHINTILSYMKERTQTGAQIEPLEAQALEAHLAQHVDALGQADGQKARVAMDAIALTKQEIDAQQAQNADPAMEADPNAVPITMGG